ncbi:MAG: RNA-directed DNA polymerase [Aquificaceae bacterium]|nr:MAG: RNA-directed DNA polymerase [Aquificaceae bacterium]
MTQLSRQELYDKIKETSKDEYILSEMKRLGYWKEGDKPSVAATLIKRKTELQTEIYKLSREIKDPKAALQAIHKQRMAEARQRRVDTKVAYELRRYQRATDWYQRKLSTIDYLGSACVLTQEKKQKIKVLDTAKLARYQLPNISTAKELAEQMGVTLNELRFLCYTNEVSKITHYQRFGIHKKTGGTRMISAPMPRLKRLQYWVLDNLLQKIPLAEQAHGFVPSKSIVTNAKPHIGKKVVINMDLKNFFPTVSYPRIKGVFLSQGYNDEVATLFALICSEPETQTVEMDGQRYYIHSKQRYLPQGAPTSPNISNIICYKLDKRLQGLANKYGFVYTRYADDMTFSSNDASKVKALLNWVKATVTEEGFIIHPEKTRIMHQGARQEVTGLVVNEKLSVSRKQLKQFRALLYQIKKDGYDGKQWGKGGSLLPTIKGFAHFVKMVNAEKGEKFLANIKEIIDLHGYPDADKKQNKTSDDFRKAAAQGKLPLNSMRIATAPPPPDINTMIQNTDVLDLVRKELGLSENNPETTNDTAISSAQSEDNREEGSAGFLARLKTFLGGEK